MVVVSAGNCRVDDVHLFRIHVVAETRLMQKPVAVPVEDPSE